MVRQSQTPYMGILLLLLALKAALITWLIIAGPIGLSPDEAQYWTWSQQLDWGYYSKPPGIAWQIALGTLFFGNTPLGIRFPSVLLGILLPLLIYILGRRSGLKVESSFWAAAMMAFTPLGILSSMLAITDVGMVLFWTSACSVVAYALAKERTPNYYLTGLFIGLGALFKWPIYLLWVIILAFAIRTPFLRSRHLPRGIAISLLGLVPSFTWNIQHGWVTLRHVAQSLQGSEEISPTSTPLFAGNFWEFVGAQAALLSPLLFFLLLVAFASIFSKKRALNTPPAAIAFCGLTTLALLTLLGAMSLLTKVQGNWCDFAYPTAIVFLAWFAFEAVDWGRRWIQAGLLISVFLAAAILAIPITQSNDLFPMAKIPYRINPFRHMVGWDKLENAILQVGYNPEKDFLFSSKYQISSILSSYGPEQKRAYFLNLFSTRKNQFSFWPSMSEEQIGNDGYYIVAENEPHLAKQLDQIEGYIETLSPYFDKVTFEGVAPLFQSYGTLSKGAMIFKCIGYNGKEPEPSKKY